MLSRKHYKAIADIIKSEYTRFDNTGENDYEGKHSIICISQKLSHYFMSDNPQFSPRKFLDTCGLED